MDTPVETRWSSHTQYEHVLGIVGNEWQQHPSG